MKNKYYAVRKWKSTWVFSSRTECENTVKWHAGAEYKWFPTLEQAQCALSHDYKSLISQKTKTEISFQDIPFQKDSIAVDAACSGNPWVMEYRGVKLENWAEIFKEKFPLGTNNIGEFLAIIHGLARMQSKNPKITTIYSDSKTAISRIKQKKCKTQLIENPETKKLFDLISKWITRLKNNNYDTKILKRDTENRWEIPADFWRK